MVSQNDRLKTLEGFPPQPVIEVLDEENEVEYILTFIPRLNLLVVQRSDAAGEPPIAISYGTFVKSCKALKLNSENKLDRIIQRLVAAWNATDKQIKMAFFDSVPLNSLYMGRQYI